MAGVSVAYAWNEYLAATTEAEPGAYEYVELWAWRRLQDRLARIAPPSSADDLHQGV